MGPAESGSQIASYLGRLAEVPLADVDRLVSQGCSRVLEAGDSSYHQGQQIHVVGFTQSGIVRYLVTLPDGNESTKDFSFAGTFTLSFGSAAIQRPARVAIAAVVRTELLVRPYQLLLDLFESHIDWQKVGRRVAELLYVRKEQRELAFLLLDAEARYRQMRAQFGMQAEAIPQYFLATYLGVRPQSLSRLKRRIAGDTRSDIANEPG